MKQYSLRYLYSHLGVAMTNLPFEITNYNKVVAEVRGVGVKNVEGVPIVSSGSISKRKGANFPVIKNADIVEPIPVEERKDPEIPEFKRVFWVCEHGNRGRTCKHEKCRQLAIKKGDV